MGATPADSPGSGSHPLIRFDEFMAKKTRKQKQRAPATARSGDRQGGTAADYTRPRPRPPGGADAPSDVLADLPGSGAEVAARARTTSPSPPLSRRRTMSRYAAADGSSRRRVQRSTPRRSHGRRAAARAPPRCSSRSKATTRPSRSTAFPTSPRPPPCRDHGVADDRAHPHRRVRGHAYQPVISETPACV